MMVRGQCMHVVGHSSQMTPCVAHSTWLTWHNSVQFSVGKIRVHQVAKRAHFLTGLLLDRIATNFQAVPVTSMVQPSPFDLACAVS
jgi:hypothetical protein